MCGGGGGGGGDIWKSDDPSQMEEGGMEGTHLREDQNSICRS